MKRRILRGLGCAVLGLGVLSAAYPAFGQQTVAPVAAKPAATAAKPAAKPAAKKVVRWAPRSRWARRYTRWAPRSRWAWHPAAKPAKAWHPAAYAAKPAVKPAAKPAWHPAYAAKPATTWKSGTTWKPAAKPVAWTKPAAKPTAATWHAATAKPAAKITKSKTTAKPVAKPAAAKTAAKPVAKVLVKTQAAPLSMTRDANNGASAATASPIAGAGQLDYLGQAGRTLASTVIVLLLVFGGLRLYNRFKPAQANTVNTTPQGNTQGITAKGFGAGMMPVFSNLSGSRQGNGAIANDMALDQSEIGDGGLKIVGMQPLPGSGTTIYLVHIEDHMVLLGASQAGGVRMLAEWEQDNQPASEKEKAAFESFLRQQGIAAVAPREEEEEHTFATIRARLNSTADRLAGLRADFGS